MPHQLNFDDNSSLPSQSFHWLSAKRELNEVKRMNKQRKWKWMEQKRVARTLLHEGAARQPQGVAEGELGGQLLFDRVTRVGRLPLIGRQSARCATCNKTQQTCTQTKPNNTCNTWNETISCKMLWIVTANKQTQTIRIHPRQSPESTQVKRIAQNNRE